MKRKFDERWLRLTAAAMDARDALRRLIPTLDGAIAAGAGSWVADVRQVIAVHVDRLWLAIKHPR